MKMVESGEIHLGEACSPQKLPKYSIANGNVEMLEVSIQGRKIPMQDIRQRLLKKQERLFSDEPIECMNYDTLHAAVTQHKPIKGDVTVDELRQLLRCLQRTPMLNYNLC